MTAGVAVAFGGMLPASTPQALAAECVGEALVDQSFASGARWETCWRIDDRAGLVLHDLWFTTADGTRRKVLREVALAKLRVAFDDGGAGGGDLLLDAGLGGGSAATLGPGECSGGTRLAAGGRALVCQRVRPRGYTYKYYGESGQGELLELHAVARIDSHTAVVRWRLYDDGIVDAALGLGPRLDVVGSDARFGWPLGAGDYARASLSATYWRIDFDIGGNGANDIVEEFEVTPTADRRRKTLTVSRITTESARSLNADLKRSWRVRDASIENADGHRVSYHLEPLHHGFDAGLPASARWASAPLYVTRADACERLLDGNTGAGCGADIIDFVDGESVDAADVVLWYGIVDHHFPAAEDDPFAPIRWRGFQLVPRDWTADNPLAVLSLLGAPA